MFLLAICLLRELFHFILVSMYQFWCSWEILLTVAVIHELRLKLEGGDEPSSF